MKKKSKLESTCEAETRLEEVDSVRDYVRPARKRFAAKKERALELDSICTEAMCLRLDSTCNEETCWEEEESA